MNTLNHINVPVPYLLRWDYASYVAGRWWRGIHRDAEYIAILDSAWLCDLYTREGSILAFTTRNDGRITVYDGESQRTIPHPKSAS